jgi:hypothetical protein
MAQRFRCDGCGQERPPENGSSTPPGWFTTYQAYNGTPDYLRESAHFCSAACGATFMQRLAQAEIARAQLAAGPAPAVAETGAVQ